MYIDNTTQLNITGLRRDGALKEGRRKFTVTWTDESSISIEADMWSDNDGKLRLYYSVNGESVSYWVMVVKRPSNLGKGDLVFFICPYTHKLCRKLYLQGGKFISQASRYFIYKSQGQNRPNAMMKRIINWFDADEVVGELLSKHFKTHYNGVPTKKYLKLMRRLQSASDPNEHKELREYLREYCSY